MYQQVKIPLTEKNNYSNIKSLKIERSLLAGTDFLENDLEKAVLNHYPLLERIKEAFWPREVLVP